MAYAVGCSPAPVRKCVMKSVRRVSTSFWYLAATCFIGRTITRASTEAGTVVRPARRGGTVLAKARLAHVRTTRNTRTEVLLGDAGDAALAPLLQDVEAQAGEVHENVLVDDGELVHDLQKRAALTPPPSASGIVLFFSERG